MQRKTIMNKKQQSKRQLFDRKKWLLIGIIAATLLSLLIIGLLFASKQVVIAIEADAGKRKVNAVSIFSKNEEKLKAAESQARIEAMKVVAKELPKEACQNRQWWQFGHDLSELNKQCDLKQKALDSLRQKVMLSIDFLEYQKKMGSIFAPLLSGEREDSLVFLEQQAKRWETGLAELEKSTAPKSAQGIQQSLRERMQGVVASWKPLIEAYVAQDAEAYIAANNGYTEAVTALRGEAASIRQQINGINMTLATAMVNFEKS